MAWKIFGLFVSIFMIIGGLSGELVLRGTDSSGALVVFGIGFLIWDIISIARHKNAEEIGAVPIDPTASSAVGVCKRCRDDIRCNEGYVLAKANNIEEEAVVCKCGGVFTFAISGDGKMFLPADITDNYKERELKLSLSDSEYNEYVDSTPCKRESEG
ncbi:MAG: hypothetical protein FWH07_06845 [Oscillospiraceae bacterium]|nr:hypothetical protein [Oscillospiraceae bacterium]